MTGAVAGRRCGGEPIERGTDRDQGRAAAGQDRHRRAIDAQAGQRAGHAFGVACRPRQREGGEARIGETRYPHQHGARSGDGGSGGQQRPRERGEKKARSHPPFHRRARGPPPAHVRKRQGAIRAVHGNPFRG
jgi:hypothetical protein